MARRTFYTVDPPPPEPPVAPDADTIEAPPVPAPTPKKRPRAAK